MADAAPLERLVRALGLDRRKRYVEWQGVLCTREHTTIDCTGCTEHGDYGTVLSGPNGCDECGYTGKRRIEFPDPVTVNGEFVPVS